MSCITKVKLNAQQVNHLFTHFSCLPIGKTKENYILIEVHNCARRLKTTGFHELTMDNYINRNMYKK